VSESNSQLCRDLKTKDNSLTATFHRVYKKLGLKNQEQLLAKLYPKIKPDLYAAFCKNHGLTDRQSQVLLSVLKGNDQTTASEKLNIGYSTFLKEFPQIRLKLGVDNHMPTLFRYVHGALAAMPLTPKPDLRGDADFDHLVP
jgi:DNA-binding CsgD family transcriptional regulator